MQTFDDYYETLGVSPTATGEEIKRAYLDKSYILHPDRLAGVPESAKNKAEAELKKVNVAYDTLKDSRKRGDYDLKVQRLKQEPKPSVDPPLLRFNNVKPHEVQKGTFVIRNLGGPYSKINISNPNSWLKVVKWASLSSADELPLRVEVEAEPDEWGKSYAETVTVSLDDVETRVTVQLQTPPPPVAKPAAEASSHQKLVQPMAQRALTGSLFSWMKLLIGVLIIASALGTIFMGIVAFAHRLPPLVGALSFIAVFVLTVVLAKITRSEAYRWRKPSFGLVLSCTAGLVLVFAFSGVQPFSGYKDAVFKLILAAYHAVIQP